MQYKISGYMNSDMTEFVDFEGKVISKTVRIQSKWKTPRSWVSDCMYQIMVNVEGVWYTGRTPGGNMYANLKICKRMLQAEI